MSMMLWDALAAFVIGVFIVALSRYYLPTITIGHPVAIKSMLTVYLALKYAPSTTLVWWKRGEGLQIAYYDEANDEDRVGHSGIYFDIDAPTLFVWHLNWGEKPIPAQAAARRAWVDLAMRIVLMLSNSVMLGAAVNMTFTESWLWAVPAVAFGVHFLVIFRIRRHYWLSTKVHYLQACIGVFAYLQEGVWHVVGACVLGGLFVMTALLTWYFDRLARTNPWMHDQIMRRSRGARRDGL